LKLDDENSNDKKSSTLDTFKSIISDKVKSVEWVGAFESFSGIQNPTPLVILHYDNKHQSDKIHVSYSKQNLFGFPDESYYASDLSGITIDGSKYETHILPFYKKIMEYISKNGSLVDIRITKPDTLDESKFHCQLKQLMGNTDVKERLYGSSFFCFINQKNDYAVHKYADGTYNMSRQNNFQFDTEAELNNFVNYLKSDFARFCLHFVKFNKNLSRQFFTTTPLMDFKEEWTDERLYEYFDVSPELIKHITTFLPDFHGIRK
jgi:hypothetical protein